MAILYLDGASGISGDMAAAALLDLGADQAGLLRALKSLDIGGYSLEVSRVLKKGLEACDFKVILTSEPHHHEDHNHGGRRHEDQGRALESEPGEHRNIKDIQNIIERSLLNPRAKHIAETMFYIVAEAEAKAHGLPLEQVHFHEVGAVDSIIDIVSVAFCLDNLHISEAVIGVLNEGSGWVHCRHGRLPVPVPATLNILSAYHLPLTITDVDGEMITPTGAAIAAAIKTRERLPGKFVIRKIGLGAGKKDFDHPNILRALLLEEDISPNEDQVWVLETNLDDCSAEALAFTLERLLEGGAKDAFFTPIFMKKNRPAYSLTVICDEAAAPALERIIFTHTSAIGLRRQRLERTVLERKIITVKTQWGEAEVKKTVFDGRACCYPEYESVRRICLDCDLPFPLVYETVKRLADGE